MLPPKRVQRPLIFSSGASIRKLARLPDPIAKRTGAAAASVAGIELLVAACPVAAPVSVSASVAVSVSV
ncbi:MAG: hypothetical protein OXT09_22820 [Myxococcales bacterium]|nr:hypothetical protein [Myxococcales bacterium]